MSSLTGNDQQHAQTVIVLGGDTPLGVSLSARLAKVNLRCIPWSVSRALTDDPEILRNLAIEKRPVAIINCLAFATSVKINSDNLLRFLTNTHAAIQVCMQRSAMYLHTSSCAVYGQDAKIEGRVAYEPFDPAVPDLDNPKSWLAFVLEKQALQQLQASCPDLWRDQYAPTGFAYGFMRFGDLIAPPVFDHNAETELTVSSIVKDIVHRRVEYVYCDKPSAIISPVTATYASACVLHYLRNPHKIPSQIFNIGSREPITLHRFFSEVARNAGTYVHVLGKTKNGTDKSLKFPCVNTAVSPAAWIKSTKVKVATAMEVALKCCEEIATPQESLVV